MPSGYVDVSPGAPHRRAYEQTWWAHALVWGQRLGPFIGMAFMAMLAFGFQFRTPSSWFNELKEEQAEIRGDVGELEYRLDAEEDRARTTTYEINRKLDVLIRIRCLELTARERATIDIDCSP